MAGVQETFMTYEIYDDAITLRLVQEACKMLGKYNFVRCKVGKIIIWSPADFYICTLTKKWSVVLMVGLFWQWETAWYQKNPENKCICFLMS